MRARDLRREADLFAASFFGEDELVDVPGFFASGVSLAEQQVRDAIVARANAEWTAWHTAAGAPRREGEAAMFGRLVGYYASIIPSLTSNRLTALQAAALPHAQYATLLAATTQAAIQTESDRLAGVLLAGVPGAPGAAVTAAVAEAIQRAVQANTDAGVFAAWSGVFIVACVRGAAIALRLETPATNPRAVLLRLTFRHAEYTVTARTRRAATAPRQRGTYHAFAPRALAPRLGDIIVQDRRDTITQANQVTTLAALPEQFETHGDIVVEVHPRFVVTIGGNLGGSCRKRRYPRDAQGLLVVDNTRLFAHENNSGTLPPLPGPTAEPLADLTTARIFALLTPVPEHASVPTRSVL